MIGRLYAERLSERLGQPIVVDNRPGAMTQLATDVLTHADPDGYTLMLGPSELVMLPFLKKDYPFDPTRDITPVALVTTSWTLFAVYPGLPMKTLPEFIDYAKARPGKLRYGSGGVGGALHIAVEMLKLKTGIDMIHVPYRGGEQDATDAMAGQIDMASIGLASGRVAEGGKLRLLAQTGPKRHPLYPDVPTTAEYGLPDVRMDTWFGLIAPPKRRRRSSSGSIAPPRRSSSSRASATTSPRSAAHRPINRMPRLRRSSPASSTNGRN